jgi:signal transduction histidine kinase
VVGIEPDGRPRGPLEVLQGMSHAFGSAPHLSEATASTIRWALALLGPEAGARVVLPDRTGRLRVAAAGGAEATAGRKRSARRRSAYETKRPAVLELRRPSGRALVLMPLVSRGRAVGIMEIVAPRPLVEDRWETLEAVASQAAIAIGNLRERTSLERQVQALGAAAALVRELVGAPTLEEATRRTMRLCFELLHAPVAAWATNNGDRRRLSFLGVRGVGRAKREAIRKAVPSLPRWENLRPAERRDAAARFAGIAEVPDAAAIDAGDAMILVGTDVPSSRASLKVVSSLFQEVLKRLTAMSRAERRSERLDLGIAWTAHEVREPLLAAKATIENLIEANGNVLHDMDLLIRSRRELTDLAGLVDALLRWAVGAGPLHLQSADLVSTVREVVESCAREAGEGRVMLTAPDEVTVQADPKQLRGAISNVVRNAVAYSPQGSRVEVSVEAGPRVATVRVRDEGPGIPRQERDSIFDPLARGQSGRSAREGKGLGLFIARRVIEAHGGAIWAESSSGKGATFSIVLPLQGNGHRRGPGTPEKGFPEELAKPR